MIDLQALPKIELHAHLLGTVRKQTFLDLCRKVKAPIADAEVDAFYTRGEKPVGVLRVLRALDEWLLTTPADFHRLTYASSGIGTLPHLAMEMVKRRANLHVVHIPYRGGAQIATDVMGKQIELAMLISASALPPIKSGGVKALAVTGDTRLTALPTVPLISESKLRAFQGYNVVSWSGLYAPAKTPQELVQRMSEEVSAVLKLDAVKGRLAEQSVFAQGGSPAAFTQFIERDRAWVMEILKTLSLKE